MSRKHFRAIADTIRAIGDAGARRRAAIALANLLQTANPRSTGGNSSALVEYNPMNTSEKVAEWLRGCPDTSEVSPVVVTIGKQTYHGAAYRQRGQPGIYLAGDLPASYRRSTHTCFRFADDSRDWFVGCYWQGASLRPDQKAFHPFGHSFILLPWEHSEAIDHWEEKPYRRITAIRGKP